MRPLIWYLREGLGYRMLPYVDDFLVAPSRFGVTATLSRYAIYNTGGSYTGEKVETFTLHRRNLTFIPTQSTSVMEGLWEQI